MQAFGIVKFGGPEELKEHRLPIPLLRPRDVLVRVVAVAMNPVDVKVG
jgi:NADPH:quinone reductase-like Zn-dependent oxidoreductase